MPRAGSAPPANSARQLTLEIDWDRRYALMRLHTALHVMSCVVVAPVTGGNIAPDKARLDFDIDMSLLDAAHIEHETNALIARGSRDRNRLDHRRGARRAARARQDHERAAAARRGPRAAAAHSRDRPAALRRHARRATSARSARSVCCKIRNEGKRNKRVEIALAPGHIHG